jgi:hypothetical protein
VKYLIENKNPLSILNLSGSAVMDYKNTYNIVNELQPEIISQEKIGNTNLIRLKLVPNPNIYSVENKRTEEFLLKYPKLKIVKTYAEELNYPFLIALVYGSYVKKTNTESSDIDVCIISDNKEKTKELISKLRFLPLNL